MKLINMTFLLLWASIPSSTLFYVAKKLKTRALHMQIYYRTDNYYESVTTGYGSVCNIHNVPCKHNVLFWTAIRVVQCAEL